jgi:transposase
MALGKRQDEKQKDLFVAAMSIPKSPGHPFYKRLNELLKAAGFDEWTEKLCAPFYADGVGRPGIAPGVYFRMLLVGYFEGIDSQRGIAWRCADSRSLQEFLGLPLTATSPEHSSLTRVRQRLPIEVHQEVFAFVVKIAKEKGLVKGRTLAVDSTTLEANAAMKAIVRRDTSEGWKEYVRGLAEEAGIDDPSDDDLRRFDRNRPGKKVSNKDWKSPTDPDARIAKMKDGRTRLAYKAQHAIDVHTEIVTAATIHHADRPDAETIKDAIVETGGVMFAAGDDVQFREVVADKGYHKAATLAWLAERELRSYVPERRSKRKRKWIDKPAAWRQAHELNRRRVTDSRSAELQRLRSERVERSFAHTCRTGRARRTWLRGLIDVAKRYLIHVAGHNLGRIMLALFGLGTPRGLQGASRAIRDLVAALVVLCATICRVVLSTTSKQLGLALRTFDSARRLAENHRGLELTPSSTGC